MSGKRFLLNFKLILFFVLVFLAFLYVFLAPILFFTILHFPWPQVARGGKCKIVKNEIGTKHISRARKKYKNAKNTKTKNNPRGKHKTFSRHVTEFCKGNIQRAFSCFARWAFMKQSPHRPSTKRLQVSQKSL